MLEKLKASGDERLGGTLTELKETVRRMMSTRSRAVLESEHAFSQIRLARTALTAP